MEIGDLSKKGGKAALLETLEAKKAELSKLRVAQVTDGAPAKIGRIKTVRKDIARLLTAYNQHQKEAARAHYKGSKYLPTDLRAKKTRAIRRQMKPSEKYMRKVAQADSEKGGKCDSWTKRVTLKALKKAQNQPARKFALKA